jgi:hypothetical protein
VIAKAKRRTTTTTTHDDGGGYRCPKCSGRTRVSHTTTEGTTCTRRRKCEGCDHRFSTVERAEADDAGLLIRALRQVKAMRSEADSSFASIEQWITEAIATDSGKTDG